MFPFYKQHDTCDCGPACLKMVIKYYGKNISLQTLRDLCHIDREGVSIKALENAAKKIGMESKAIKCASKHGVKSVEIPVLEELPLPLIAHWKNTHFIVIYKISKNNIFIADPAIGRVKISHKTAANNLFPDNSEGKVILFEPLRQFYRGQNPYFENQSTIDKIRYISKHVLAAKRGLIFLFFIISLKLIIQAVSPFITQKAFDSGILQKNTNVLINVFSFQLIIF